MFRSRSPALALTRPWNLSNHWLAQGLIARAAVASSNEFSRKIT